MTKIIITEEKLTDVQERIKKMIHTYGLVQTSKLMGGYSNLENIMDYKDYISNESKVKAINEIVVDIVNSIEEPEDEIHLESFGHNPILVDDKEGKLRQIVIIWTDEVVIETYVFNKSLTVIDTPTVDVVRLENLEGDTLTEIIDVLMDINK